MKRKTVSIINIAAGVLVGFLVALQFSFTDSEKNIKIKKSNEQVVKYTPPKIPSQMAFASENVPLDRWEVKERFDRELLFNYYNKANILFLMKLSNRYFPIISERLKAHGVPDDFKYLCVAESNLLSGARSHVGATGFWQFMKGTAPGYGLTVNDQIDLRSDLIESTDAAAQYLKSAYNKFGSWTAAAASFNMGQGGYNGQAKFQGSYNYYDLHLPEETNRYLFRILAFKHLMGNAEELGFHLEKEEAYEEIPSKTIKVTSSIGNLATFAKNNGTSYKVLRLMNPWLRGRSLTVSGGKTYELKVPATEASSTAKK